ncbi:hypothetical protein DPMN_104707 [Dreissena polymorpha]|uniref:Uncharacterized protein n=1 Tax=Dreissena polymorpha TaxID=45954 RepID=A0A9D4K0A4_DREPO|nr:hypothetical protein DPMN_104707 [Dreissena polymorpha]
MTPSNPLLYGFNSLQDTLCFLILVFYWRSLVSKSSPLTRLIHSGADNEPLILEDYEIPQSGIPTFIPAGYMQTTDLADGSAEAGSASNIEAEHYYLTSINQVYNLCLRP